MDAGAWSEARDVIQESIDPLEQSIQTVRDQIGHGPHPNHDAVAIKVELLHIRALKTQAWALSKAKTGATARERLSEAVTRERAVAQEAARTGVTL